MEKRGGKRGDAPSLTAIFGSAPAFAAADPRIWNSLPADVRSAPSLTTLRQKLKTHLFRESYILFCSCVAIVVLEVTFLRPLWM